MQYSLNAPKVYAYDIGSDITFLDFLLSNIKLIFLLISDIPINPCVVGEDVEHLTGRYFPSLVPAVNPWTNDRSHKRWCFVTLVEKEQQKDIPSKPFMCASFALHNMDCT